MEKKKQPRFSPSEDEVIIKWINEYPTNLRMAFLQASIELDPRTTAAIELRWYRYLKHRKNVNILTCGSVKGFTKNRKNVLRKDGEMPEQDLRGIDYVMKELLNLTWNDRKKILSFFK